MSKRYQDTFYIRKTLPGTDPKVTFWYDHLFCWIETFHASDGTPIKFAFNHEGYREGSRWWNITEVSTGVGCGGARTFREAERLAGEKVDAIAKILRTPLYTKYAQQLADFIQLEEQRKKKYATEMFLLLMQNGMCQAVFLRTGSTERLVHSIHEVLDCDTFESVPTTNPMGYLILVDGNGRFVPGNVPNLVAGFYHGDVLNGIVGDALIGKMGYRNGEPDIVGLDDHDFRFLSAMMPAEQHLLLDDAWQSLQEVSK